MHDPATDTHLQPDILSRCGDGGDLEGGLAVPGGQFAGVDVVLWGQLRLHAHLDPIGRASVWICDLYLWEPGVEEKTTAIGDKTKIKIEFDLTMQLQ